MGIMKRTGGGSYLSHSGVRAVKPQPAANGDSSVNLRRLSRVELLELLLEETEENERLRAELADVRRHLESHEITLQESGSIAEASLRLNGVFEAAQRAADQYLENVRRRSAASGSPEAMEAQTRARCEQMLRDARLQAESYLQSARLQDQQIAGSNAVGLQEGRSPYQGQAARPSYQSQAAHFKPSRDNGGRDAW